MSESIHRLAIEWIRANKVAEMASQKWRRHSDAISTKALGIARDKETEVMNKLLAALNGPGQTPHEGSAVQVGEAVIVPVYDSRTETEFLQLFNLIREKP